LPVRVVGVGGGLDYGQNGLTHYALEDIALMRVQPELTVILPSDALMTESAVAAATDYARPLYLRLEKEGTPIPGLAPFVLGRASLRGDGRDVAIVAVGSMVRRGAEVQDLLAERGVAATLAAVTTLNPSPLDDLADLLDGVPLALTLEEHYLAGGVGSLVCEVVAAHGLDCRVIRAGVRSMPRGMNGSRAYLHGELSLDAEAIVSEALRALRLGAS
jgi:transketolase